MAVTKSASEQLERLKKNVSTAYTYFLDNYRRYRDFRRYVFKENINEQQRTVLQQLNRPVVEFNVVEPSISMLLGEFSKQEPGIEVGPSEGVPVNQDVLNVVEGSIRHAIHSANKNSFSYEIYKDILSGGFSVARIRTDFSNPMSFSQDIFWEKEFDPTLCGFDPMARASHKGDGKFSFAIRPYLEEEALEKFPSIKTPNVGYTRDLEEFNWSYKDSQDRKIILIADYFEKKSKKVRIVKLANGRSMTEKNYEKLKEYWEREQFIEQIPVVVSKRMTELQVICNYVFMENQLLEYRETDYSMLPHVFFDGNSINLTQGTNNNTYQMTRPYVYHAKGVQDMINYAGQTICNSMENLIQHKFIVMKEAIPQEQDYIEALNDIQRANTVVVNAYSENNPDKPIPNPIREVQNIPLPPEVMNAFQVGGPMVQTILGSFSSNLGKTSNDLSGKAIIESATLDNASAMPYIVGYLAGLTQMANIHVDLMPKYIIGNRTIPVMDKAWKKTYQEVNTPGNPLLDYDERAIKVNIDAGVNFTVQKSQALQQIIGLMQASPEFSQFMNSPKGLEILVDNLTIYSADQLKEAVPEWIQQQQQMQQQAMQAQQEAMQRDPRMLKAQSDQMKVQLQAKELELNEQQLQFDNQIQIAKLANEKILNDSKMLEAEAKVSNEQIAMAIKLEESETSHFNHATDAAVKFAEIEARQHERKMNEHHATLATHKLVHEIRKSSKGDENDNTKIQTHD